MSKKKFEAVRSLAKTLESALMRGTFRFDSMVEMADKLRLAAVVLDRINLNRCNGIERWDEKARQRLATWTEADETAAEKAQEKARASAAAVVAEMNAFASNPKTFRVEFNGDPRGAAIKIFIGDESTATGYF